MPNGECRYFLTDQVDSVNVVLNDKGDAVTRTEYKPYGETWVQEGDKTNRPKFNSRLYLKIVYKGKISESR